MTLIALMAVGLPLVPADLSSRAWHGAKALIFELGAALLLGLAPWFRRRSRADGDPKPRVGPLLFLALLVSWAFASYAVSPDPGFAFNGWWLLAGGLVVSSTVALRARSDGDLLFLLAALTAASAVISGCTFALYRSGGMRVAEGTYHDHQLLGAALMILMPITLTALILPSSVGGKLLAMTAFVMGAIALLLAQDRSAWVGEATALLMFGGAFLWVSGPVWRARGMDGRRGRLPGRRQALVYGLLIAAALGYFLATSQQTGLVTGRARTLFTTALTGRDESVQWRLATWRGAVKMFLVRPGFGWGVGCYPVYEAQFTGHGDPEADVAFSAARVGDETHNSYLQLAVELGAPGPALWLLMLGAAFGNGLRALRRLPQGDVRQWALIGGLSALAGQAVDAFADPAWQFGEITVSLWVILGLVAAASALPPPAVGSPEAGPSGSRRAAEAVKLLLKLAAVAVSLWVVAHLIAAAHDLPIPHL